MEKLIIKLYLTLVIIISSLYCFSRGNNSDLDYTIIFTGNYQNDIISLSINNKQVILNYQLNNIDSLIKGHLNIAQKKKYIEILYNGKKTNRKKIKLNHILEMDISINKKTEKIKVDLRKGKILLITYNSNNSSTDNKQITLEQIQEPLIFQELF